MARKKVVNSVSETAQDATNGTVVSGGTGGKVRACGVCGEPLPAGSYHTKKYHPECAVVRWKEQLRYHHAKARVKHEEKSCKICDTLFVQVNKLQVYCSGPCQAEGQRRCIEQQTNRRELAKMVRRGVTSQEIGSDTSGEVYREVQEEMDDIS